MTSVSAENSGNAEVTLSGVVGLETVNALFDATPTFDDRPVSISMQDVTEIDSAGLALLLHWQQCAKGSGGQLVYVDVPEQARSMMQVSGLEQALTEGAD